MNKDDSKFSMWVVLAAVACCGLPLLLLAGGGSILALIIGFFTQNTLILFLALVLIGITVWLFIKNRL